MPTTGGAHHLAKQERIGWSNTRRVMVVEVVPMEVVEVHLHHRVQPMPITSLQAPPLHPSHMCGVVGLQARA